jgi:GDP-D-mannose 3',5'-epimerase
MRSALVCGAGGFIGGHLVKRLKSEGFWVRGVDLKNHEYASSQADDFIIGDLRDQYFCRQVIDRRFDEVYQLAADMGGAGFVFVGDNDADIMRNSGLINIRRMLYAIDSADILFLFCLYLSCLQSDESGFAKLRREFRVPCCAGQRIRLGKTL